MQRNYTVDIIRIIGAFCVVVLHSPLGTLPNLVALGLRLGSRWAVPFFFLVSGYLIARRTRESGQNVEVAKSINNLIAIFIISNIIYLLYFLLDHNPATPTDLTFTSLFIGQRGHLWFIGASIFALILLQYVTSRYSDLVVLCLAITVLLVVVGSDGYSKVSGVTMQYEIARYLTSIPFIFIGYLISRYNARLPRLSALGCLLWIIAGFLLEFGEATLLYLKVGSSPHNQELLLGTTIVALGIFYFSLTVPIATENKLAKNGRVYSLLIYLYHPLLIMILFDNMVIGKYGNWLYWISPILVFSILLFILKLLHKNSPRIFAILSGL